MSVAFIVGVTDSVYCDYGIAVTMSVAFIVGVNWFITDSVYFHYGIAVTTFCCDIVGFIVDFVFIAAIDFYDIIYMRMR